MEFERSRSCPTGKAARPIRAVRSDQLVAADEFKLDDFNFDSCDNSFASGRSNVLDSGENDGRTVCSEPPKPSVPTKMPTYNNNNRSPSRSPTSVYQFMDQIPEDKEDNKYNLSLREDYSVIQRKTSDITEVVCNTESGESPMSKNKGNTPTRNPNLVVMGSLNKHMNDIREEDNKPQPKSPPLSAFRRLFACGAPEVIQDFKTNVKEEVKGSFGDLGLTVRQVFSPVQNTKAGAGMVKKKVLTRVKKMKGQEADDDDDEHTDDDGHTDDDDRTDEDDVTDEDEEVSESGSSIVDSLSESGSSIVDSESEYNTDDASVRSF